MAIGYERAKNLMKQLDWKAKVKMLGNSVEEVELYHPLRPNRYKVRIDSATKVLASCRKIKDIDAMHSVWCFDSEGSNERLT